ncbi:phosphotransferase family protein [Nonomuraea soli]|uniref:Aminoglycoside phosphotransferase (APT) family kinase protein n=1 Tax=Nonomuraea soli TaxID=1032476 RepID=A0A7W0HUJ8_9ACTN|nr:phosphotransferase family protein [Nonomuraea soli]MBA2896228.1 aminoglycoside phosphotransferase (APT) family kinase protein [Nonomuraea soli]
MTSAGDPAAGVVHEVFGDQARVSSAVRLPGGASRETWSLDVRAGGVTHELVLRMDGPGTALETGAGSGLAAEARLMRAAAETGVPVPRIVAEGTAGRPYLLMSRVDGQTIPRKILRDPEFAGARESLTEQCGAALAAIHRMPLTAVAEDPPPDPLRQWRDVLDLTGRAHPAFELAFRRLDETRPDPGGIAVVHGDFRNGNLVVGPEGLRAVLDWELAHVGDPIEDLGWLCVRAWRFGSPRPVGGFGDYDTLVAAYEKAGGRRVDPAALRWWETFGVLKWGVICVMQAMRHLEGGARSVELAAIGRRVCETEWDLLNLL